MTTPLRVLIVEDRPADAELMKRELRRAGFAPQARVVDDEAEFSAALDEQPQIILCDFSLATFNALRALEIVRARGCRAPVIIVTGTQVDERAVECIRRGAVDYLLKDRLARLGAAVTAALDRQRMADEVRRAQVERAELLERQRLLGEHLRRLLDSISEGVFGVDARGRCTFANAEVGRMLGYDPPDMVGKEMHALLHAGAGEGRACVAATCPLESAMLVEQRTRFDSVLWRRDGRCFDAECSASPIADPLISGIVVSIVDITERRRAERALHEQEERYRMLFESSQDAILVMKDGRFIDCNPRAVEMLRATRDDIVGRSAVELSPPLQADGRSTGDMVAEMIGAALAGRAVVFDWRFLRKDGSQGDAEAIINRIVFAGEPVLMGVVRDVTERRRAEEALRLSESNLREAQAIAHVGSWEWQVAEGRVSWSDEMRAIFEPADGEPLSSLEAVLPYVHAADRERLASEVHRALDTSGSFSLDYRIELPGGGQKIVHANGVVVSGPDEPRRMRGTVQEITQRRRIERGHEAEFEVARILVDAETEEEAIPRVLETMSRILEWDVAEYWRVDSGHGLLRHAGDWNAPGDPIEQFNVASRPMTFARGSGLPGAVWDTREPAWIEEQMGISGLPQASQARAAGVEAGVGFPVNGAHGEVLGVVTFFHRSARRTDAELLRVLEAIGTQIGQFIRRREAERSVADSERYFRRLIENASDLVTIADQDLVHRFVSPSLKSVLGYEPAEALGHPVLAAVHGEDAPRVASLANRLRDSPERVESIEYRARHKDGSWHILDARIVNLLDDPVVRGFVINSRDITDRRRLEDDMAIRVAALTAAANGIMITDPDGRIVWVNPAISRLTGYSAEEAVGNTPRLWKSGRQGVAFYATLWETLRSGRVWTGGIRNRRKDGELYDEEMTITPVKRNGRLTHFIAVKQDVTSRKRSQQLQREALLRIEQSDRLKSAFLANMSHEVRTPLNVILGFNALIADRLAEPRDPDVEQWLDAVRRAGDRLLQTIHGIIDLSRLETGTFEAHREPLDLVRLVKECAGRFEDEARKKGIALHCAVALDRADLVADRYCLDQALRHLLGNALKFTDAGGVRVRLDRDATGQLRVTIADSGVGIDGRYLPHLFEPFSQEDVGSTRRYEGPGIGLALVKRYLALDGAAIEVSSTKGEGTRMTLVFPSVAASDEGAGPEVHR